MPNSKSAAKRMRTSAEARDANKSVKSRIATVRREADEAFASGDKVKSEAAFRALCSLLDKAAKKGAVHPRNAARRKGRLMKQLFALGSQPQSPAVESPTPVTAKSVDKKPAKVEKEAKPVKEAKPKVEKKKTPEKKPAAKKTPAKK